MLLSYLLFLCVCVCVDIKHYYIAVNICVGCSDRISVERSDGGGDDRCAPEQNNKWETYKPVSAFYRKYLCLSDFVLCYFC